MKTLINRSATFLNTQTNTPECAMSSQQLLVHNYTLILQTATLNAECSRPINIIMHWISLLSGQSLNAHKRATAHKKVGDIYDRFTNKRSIHLYTYIISPVWPNRSLNALAFTLVASSNTCNVYSHCQPMLHYAARKWNAPHVTLQKHANNKQYTHAPVIYWMLNQKTYMSNKV